MRAGSRAVVRAVMGVWLYAFVMLVAVGSCGPAENLARADAALADGKVEDALGLYRGVADATRGVAAKNTLYVEALWKEGETLAFHLDRKEEGARAFQAAVDAADDAGWRKQHLIEFAEFLTRTMNDARAAADTYARLIELYPTASETPRWRLSQAERFHKLGDFQRVYAVAADFAAKHPDHPARLEVSILAAEGYGVQGLHERAASELQRSLAALDNGAGDDPALPTLRARANFALGAALFQLQQFEQAQAAYQAALLAHPDPAEVQRRIASARERHALLIDANAKGDARVQPRDGRKRALSDRSPRNAARVQKARESAR